MPSLKRSKRSASKRSASKRSASKPSWKNPCRDHWPETAFIAAGHAHDSQGIIPHTPWLREITHQGKKRTQIVMDLGRDSVELVCSRCAKIVARSSMHKHIKACKYRDDPNITTGQITATALNRHTVVATGTAPPVRKFVSYFVDRLRNSISHVCVFSNCHQEGMDSPPSSDDETPDPAVTGKSEDTGVPAASGVKDTAAVRKFVSYFLSFAFACDDVVIVLLIICSNIFLLLFDHLRNFVYIFFDHLRKFVLSSGSGGFPSLQRRQNTPLQGRRNARSCRHWYERGYWGASGVWSQGHFGVSCA